MASLHFKSFHVQVFLPGSLSGPEPDINASLQALTEITAVLRVMERCCVSEAEVVSVALLDGERWWLHDVRVVNGEVIYRQAVPG
ncbi:MAG TPA: hypothetical protein VEL31_02290 [Ktedonobacteraceae bacterium]|nr:hypothetical protein [Ktedonobacteraceae bacterium]